MEDACLEFGVGALSFSIAGSETWAAQQFDKVLEYIASLDLETLTPAAATTSEGAGTKTVGPAVDNVELSSTTLVAFLAKCNAANNANRKVIATALWSMAKQGKKTFTLKDVTSALTTAQQSKLANPSTSLARVVKAGHAEQQSAGEYYITPAGRKEVGLSEDGL